MSERSPDVETLAALLAARAQEGGGGAGPDPEPEELLDYLEGRLSAEADAAMQRRLVASPAATRRLLDLADLAEAGRASEATRAGRATTPPPLQGDSERATPRPPLQGDSERATPRPPLPRDSERATTRPPLPPGEGRGEGDEAPADLALHAAWRDFERRLAGGESEGTAPGTPARPAPAARPPRWNALSGGLAALAATLLVAVLALGAWVSRLERAGGPGAGVVANLRTLEIPQATRSEAVPSVRLAPGEPFAVLLEAPPERCPSYRAEITTPAGTLRQVPGLVRDELANLSFLFQGEPGRHAVRLFGCEPERQLSTYGFEILPPGGDFPTGSERNAPER